MRFYNIELFKAGTTTLVRQFTSFPGGRPDPGALNIILDCYVNSFALPTALTVVQIWGVSLADISQASNFTGLDIKISAGFQKGLPLDNPAQAGVILAGNIYQSFANWQGTEMTLDFVVSSAGSLASQNNNLAFHWPAGTPLATALATTFKAAFPTATPSISISPNLILNHDEWGSYTSLLSLAQTLKPLTAEILGGNYAGVDIATHNGSPLVWDGTVSSNPTAIAFQDLIGQPTWLGQYVIQFMSPMRAALTVGAFITMPKGLLGNQTQPFGAPGAVTTTTASQPQARQNSAFSGTFQVTQVHHMGNFRQADGQSWATVINATLQAPSGVGAVGAAS